jgi:hypothetical protein
MFAGNDSTTNTPNYTEYATIDGTLPEVYEDQDFDPSGLLTLRAAYAELVGAHGYKVGSSAILGNNIPLNTDGSQGLPADYGRAMTEFTWAPVPPGPQNVPVSTRPEAWEIERPEAAPSTKSKLRYILPEGDISGATGTDPKLPANVTTLYFVDRIEYIGGTLGKYIADEENSIYSPNKYSASNPVNWLKELSDAKARFKVYYYTGPNSELTGKTRDIGMAEYLKAYSIGKANYETSGNPNSTDPADSKIFNAGNLDDPFDLMLRMYYYPSIGAPNTTSTPWANPALVSLAGHIYTYADKIEAIRKKNTEQLNTNNAEVVGGRTTLLDLRTRLQEYYDVKVAYTNGTETIYSKALAAGDWPVPNSLMDWDFDNTAPDEVDRETRTLLIPFAVPPSAGNDTFEVEFPYDVLR